MITCYHCNEEKNEFTTVRTKANYLAKHDDQWKPACEECVSKHYTDYYKILIDKNNTGSQLMCDGTKEGALKALERALIQNGIRATCRVMKN